MARCRRGELAISTTDCIGDDVPLAPRSAGKRQRQTTCTTKVHAIVAALSIAASLLATSLQLRCALLVDELTTNLMFDHLGDADGAHL